MNNVFEKMLKGKVVVNHDSEAKDIRGGEDDETVDGEGKVVSGFGVSGW